MIIVAQLIIVQQARRKQKQDEDEPAFAEHEELQRKLLQLWERTLKKVLRDHHESSTNTSGSPEEEVENDQRRPHQPASTGTEPAHSASSKLVAPCEAGEDHQSLFAAEKDPTRTPTSPSRARSLLPTTGAGDDNKNHHPNPSTATTVVVKISIRSLLGSSRTS